MFNMVQTATIDEIESNANACPEAGAALIAWLEDVDGFAPVDAPAAVYRLRQMSRSLSITYAELSVLLGDVRRARARAESESISY